MGKTKNPTILTIMLTITIILSLTATTNKSNATELDYTETKAIISETSATIITEYKIIATKIETIQFEIPEDVKKVNINIRDEWTECQIKTINKIKIADCGKIGQGRYFVIVNYTTKKPIESLGKPIMFNFEDNLPFKTESYTFILELPKGYIIPKKEDSIQFFLKPTQYETTSDGQKIKIIWKDRKIQNFQVLAIIQPLIDQKNQNTITIIIASVILTTITAIAIIYLIKIKNKEKNKNKQTTPPQKTKKKKKKEIVPDFIESEKKIVDLLKNSPNKEMWQKQILNETKFSKAKLSRIIRNLESRGVITKTIYGNTNKISLIEK